VMPRGDRRRQTGAARAHHQRVAFVSFLFVACHAIRLARCSWADIWVRIDRPVNHAAMAFASFARRCPWHGWEFAIRNGQSYFDPKRVKVRSYPVVVASGEELQKGPVRGRDVSGACRGQLRHHRDVSDFVLIRPPNATR
jgi:hypothetical protein